MIVDVLNIPQKRPRLDLFILPPFKELRQIQKSKSIVLGEKIDEIQAEGYRVIGLRVRDISAINWLASLNTNKRNINRRGLAMACPSLEDRQVIIESVKL